MRPIRIALTKGRLEKMSVQLFTKMGLDCTALIEKGRRLILPVGPYEVVLAKAADVITYIEHGVCDIGVVGKDTIVENGASFYEVTDLGFGRCRFALAGPVGKNFFSGYNVKRIATKYPKVARSYFESKGMDVQIIKIEGSVELAPLLGLSDAIPPSLGPPAPKTPRSPRGAASCSPYSRSRARKPAGSLQSLPSRFP